MTHGLGAAAEQNKAGLLCVCVSDECQAHACFLLLQCCSTRFASKWNIEILSDLDIPHGPRPTLPLPQILPGTAAVLLDLCLILLSLTSFDAPLGVIGREWCDLFRDG